MGLLAVLSVLVVAVQSNDSSLFDCPKGKYLAYLHICINQQRYNFLATAQLTGHTGHVPSVSNM